ncbi:MAG: hypothetical protein H7339_11935, partial [Arcicella sp.]|nr:hypothetical protein [Arcicella sp.]
MNHGGIFRKSFLLLLVVIPVLFLESCSSGGSKSKGKSTASNKARSSNKSKGEVASKGKGGKSSRSSKKEDVGMVNGEVAATARKGWK